MANGPIDNKSTVQDTIEQELENYKMLRQQMKTVIDDLSLGMPSAQDVTEALGANEQFADKYVGTRVPGITPLIPKTKEVHDKNVIQLGKYFTQNKDRLNDLDDPTAMTDYSQGLYNKLKKGAKYFYKHQDLLAMVNDHVMVEAENRSLKIDARTRSNYINAAINTTIPKLLTEGDREGTIQQIQIVNSMYNWFEQQDMSPNSETGRFITSVYNDVSGKQDNLNSFLQQSILNPNRNFTLNDFTLAMTDSSKFNDALTQQSHQTLRNELDSTGMPYFSAMLAFDALIGKNGIMTKTDDWANKNDIQLRASSSTWSQGLDLESKPQYDKDVDDFNDYVVSNKSNVEGFVKDIYDFMYSDSINDIDDRQKLEFTSQLAALKSFNNPSLGVDSWLTNDFGFGINLEELEEDYISDLHNNATSVEEKVDIDTKNVWFNKYVSGQTEEYMSFVDWIKTPEGGNVYNEIKNTHEEEEDAVEYSDTDGGEFLSIWNDPEIGWKGQAKNINPLANPSGNIETEIGQKYPNTGLVDLKSEWRGLKKELEGFELNHEQRMNIRGNFYSKIIDIDESSMIDPNKRVASINKIKTEIKKDLLVNYGNKTSSGDKTFTDFMDGVSFSDSDKSFNKHLVSKEDKTKLLNSHGVTGHNRHLIRSLFRQLQEYKLNQDNYNKFKTEYASTTSQKHLIRAEELYNEILEGKKNYEKALERGVLVEPKFSLFGTQTPQENLMNE